MFVNVDWSFDMYFAAPKFFELSETYCSIRGLPTIGFHYLDCTSVTDGYGPLRQISGWKELEEVNHGWSLIHGHGEVVWIENGRVIKVEPLKHSATPGDLLLEALDTFQIRT